MNPIVLTALLCLAFSVADGCITTGELEYELFGGYEEPHKKLLRKSLRKKFDDGDLVVHYQVDRHNEELGTIDTSFPTVILSRSPKIMRPVYFVYRPVSSITNITAEEFIDTLYNCTSLPKIPLVRLIE
uniref:Inhibitor I9 domain-containing protein n=1 Tax=Haemonchus contortus TaxID=6289 RepID=A0A7I4YIJ5_HAECO